MGTRSVVRSAALVLAGAVQLLATAAPSAASDLPPLSEWPVVLTSGPVGLRDNDGRGWQEPGHWTAQGIRLAPDGHVRFTLRVAPAPVDLPVRSGPAVLFVGVGFFGGGSTGYERVVHVTRQALPACQRDPCTYRFKVDADLSVLPEAAAAAPVGREVQAQIGLTLVRTFGDGTWMQVLDTFRGRRMLSPRRSSGGRIASMGLVPVRAAEAWSRQHDGSTIDLARRVARSLRDLPDPSQPLPTVRVRLGVDAPGCWPYLRLAIHDEQGARPLDADLLELDPVGTVVEVPDGLEWTVTLWETGIFDGNDSGGVSVPAGRFTTAGTDLDATAHFACSPDEGSLTGSLTVAPAGGPLPDPTALRHVGSTPALEGPRPRRKRFLFTVTGTPQAFLALGWARKDGWIGWSSRAGARWRSRSVPIAAGLPSPPDLLDVRLWSVGGAPRLTTITAVPDGSRQVRIWQQAGPGGWASESFIGAGSGSGPLSASIDAGSVGAFVGHGDDALLLLYPVAVDPTGPSRLLRSHAGGEWRPAGPTDGSVTSVVATAEGFAIAVRTTGPAGTRDRLLTSADGTTWAVAGSLPTGSLELPQIAVADGTLLAFASDAKGTTRGWRREPGGSWKPMLVAPGTLFRGSVGASQRMVTVLTRIDGRGTFTAAAISHDGGRTWERGAASDESPGTCRMSLALRPPVAVVGAGRCRASQAATRLASSATRSGGSYRSAASSWSARGGRCSLPDAPRNGRAGVPCCPWATDAGCSLPPTIRGPGLVTR